MKMSKFFIQIIIPALVAIAALLLILLFSLNVATAAETPRSFYGITSAGVAKYERGPDGLWWQSMYPSENDRPGTTWSAGLGYRFNRKWHGEFTYYDFGQWKTTASYIQDDAFLEVEAGLISAPDPTESGIHGGRVTGLGISALRLFKPNDATRPYLRIGLMRNDVRFQAQIQNLEHHHRPPSLHVRESNKTVLLGGVGLLIQDRYVLEFIYFHRNTGEHAGWDSIATITAGVRW